MTVKQEVWDIFKKNFAILLIGILFLIFWFGGCNKSATGKNTSDTTTHTVYVPQPIIVNPPYVPQQAGSTVYVPIPQSSQGVIPASTIEGLIAQVKDLNTRIEALAKEYYAVKQYKDSIPLKDTSGTRVGVVNLDQTVSENTLKSTQPSYQLSFPHTTTVITNTIYPKPKNKVYVGLGAETLINTPKIQQIHAGLILQNKHENIIGLSGTYNFPTSSPGIALSYYTKISL